MPTCFDCKSVFRYRRAGHGGLVERIYFNGRLIGYSDVDLDNPLNTDLNLGGHDCFSCR